MNQKIPVLIVQPHYAELITLYKNIEVRHYPVPEKYIGQRIAIYASKTTPDKSDLNRINKFLASYKFASQITGKIRGAIVATAILKSCKKVNSQLSYNAVYDCHFAPHDYYKCNETYFWNLEDKVNLDDPFPYEFHGPIIWSSIGAEKLAYWLPEPSTD